MPLESLISRVYLLKFVTSENRCSGVNFSIYSKIHVRNATYKGSAVKRYSFGGYISNLVFRLFLKKKFRSYF